jgi:hypothetical protein
MTYNIHLTRVSTNKKTGLIPVSTTEAKTCWKGCAFFQAGCYAAGGPINIHWSLVTALKRGVAYAAFLSSICRLPRGQLWRHNAAGDLPGVNSAIDLEAFAALVKANKGRRGFTYTHKPVIQSKGVPAKVVKANAEAIKSANNNGFTVNLSANNPAHADRLAELQIGPVVVVLPAAQISNTMTPAGRKIVICPADEKKGHFMRNLPNL